jgi:hypothetical protein
VSVLGSERALDSDLVKEKVLDSASEKALDLA